MSSSSTPHRPPSLAPPTPASPPRSPSPSNSIPFPSPSHASSSSSSEKQPPRPLKTAFYGSGSAPRAPAPFSRSAAKRDSVMALGSIQHLQHMYAKHGLASKERPGNPHNSLVLALGPGAGAAASGLPALSTSPTTLTLSSSLSDVASGLPPSPAFPPPQPNKPTFPSGLSAHVDPELLRPAAERDVAAARAAWTPPEQGEPSVDVLALLKTTTHAIRSVQNYVVVLPSDDVGAPSSSSASSTTTSLGVPRPGHKRSPTLRSISHHISTASRHFSLPRPSKRSSRSSLSSNLSSDLALDPLALVRRAALDVLSALQDIEERTRTTDPAPAPARPASPSPSDSDSAPHSGSGVSTHLTGSSAAPAGPGAPLKTQYTGAGKPVLVWSDDEAPDINVLTAAEEDARRAPRERWEERLVLGNGFLYRGDVTLRELEKERGVVERYLDLVESILAVDGSGDAGEPALAGTTGKKEPAGARRVISDTTGLRRIKEREASGELEALSEGEEDEVEESSLPSWARRDFPSNPPLARLHALLIPHLPPDLAPLLPAPSERLALLERLSDGQLLCLAFNALLRRSRRPWGFIPLADVHDIVGLERAELDGVGPKGGWTFRRVENLRIWAAALKLRYLVSLSPSILPTLPSTLPAPFPAREFDPKRIARREPGWEDDLEWAAGRWIEVVVQERREQGAGRKASAGWI